ncbi:unnamed protein product [Mucor hiemalis]
MTKANSLVLLLALALLTFVSANEQGTKDQAIKVVNNGELTHPRDFTRNMKRYAEDDEGDEDEDDEDDEDEEEDDWEGKKGGWEEKKGDWKHKKGGEHELSDADLEILKKNLDLFRKNQELIRAFKKYQDGLVTLTRSGVAGHTNTITRSSTFTSASVNTKTTTLTTTTKVVNGTLTVSVADVSAVSNAAADGIIKIDELSKLATVKNVATTTINDNVVETDDSNTYSGVSTSVIVEPIEVQGTFTSVSTVISPLPTYNPDSYQCLWNYKYDNGWDYLLTKPGDPPMTKTRCYQYCMNCAALQNYKTWYFGLMGWDTTSPPGADPQSCSCYTGSWGGERTNCQNGFGSVTSPISVAVYTVNVPE